MARWMLNLDGGPKRVNHAAVAIGDKIYSFGGYSATEGFSSDFIDVHCLNTFTYRWERLPIFPIETDEKKSRRSATISGPGPDEPSTSQSSRFCRRRTQSLDLDLHPLAQIRFSNPPLFEEEDEFMDQGIQSPSPEEPPMDANNQRQNSPPRIENVQAHQMDVSVEERQERIRYRELFSGIEERLMSSDEDNESEEDVDSDFQVSIDGSMDSLDTMEIETDDEEEEEDEPRMLVRVEGLGEIEVPAGIDLRELQKFQEHPEIPFKRYGHTVCEYKGQVYLWGGRNDKYGCRQTMHKYDPVQNRWSIVQTEGSCPPARDGHTAVIWGDHMYIFGGYEERELRFSQETYAFHFPTGEWTKLKTQGDPPQYRDFHAASVIDGKMYVFGGRSDETGQSHTSHDVYDDQFRFLDLVSKKWHLLDVKGKHRPCGRRSHTMWTFDEKIFLFGGFHSIINNHFNDLWQFDTKKNEWTEIKPNGQGPLPRRRQCTVPIGEKIFLFGGTMPNSRKRGSNALEDLGDLYVLSMVPPTLASLCLQTILQNEDLRKQAETVLPSILKRELFYMSTPNQQSKSSNRVGTNMRG